MSETKNDQVDINVKEMSQHVYQHPGEPRDFDYRVQSLAFALGYEAQNGLSIDVLQTAAKFETYLRDGAQ